MKELIYSLQDIDKAVSFLKKIVQKKNIVAISGPLGAGKTTLIAQLVKNLGVAQDITSPTFSYLNIYTTKEGKKIYHFDLYRISSMQEFMSAGFDEQLYDKNALILIEWPEVILPLLAHNVAHISLDYEDIGHRKLVLMN